MKIVYQLFVNGIPKAQPRPRLAGNGKAYNPKSADAWKNQIIAAFLSCRREKIRTSVCVKVSFFFPMKKGMQITNECIRHDSKPDIDNLQKAVLDALTNAGIWQDDSLVYKIEADKWYGPTDGAGARIIIEA